MHNIEELLTYNGLYVGNKLKADYIDEINNALSHVYDEVINFDEPLNQFLEISSKNNVTTNVTSQLKEYDQLLAIDHIKTMTPKKIHQELKKFLENNQDNTKIQKNIELLKNVVEIMDEQVCSVRGIPLEEGNPHWKNFNEDGASSQWVRHQAEKMLLQLDNQAKKTIENKELITSIIRLSYMLQKNLIDNKIHEDILNTFDNKHIENPCQTWQNLIEIYGNKSIQNEFIQEVKKIEKYIAENKLEGKSLNNKTKKIEKIIEEDEVLKYAKNHNKIDVKQLVENEYAIFEKLATIQNKAIKNEIIQSLPIDIVHEYISLQQDYEKDLGKKLGYEIKKDEHSNGVIRVYKNGTNGYSTETLFTVGDQIYNQLKEYHQFKYHGIINHKLPKSIAIHMDNDNEKVYVSLDGKTLAYHLLEGSYSLLAEDKISSYAAQDFRFNEDNYEELTLYPNRTIEENNQKLFLLMDKGQICEIKQPINNIEEKFLKEEVKQFFEENLDHQVLEIQLGKKYKVEDINPTVTLYEHPKHKLAKKEVTKIQNQIKKMMDTYINKSTFENIEDIRKLTISEEERQKMYEESKNIYVALGKIEINILRKNKIELDSNIDNKISTTNNNQVDYVINELKENRNPFIVKNDEVPMHNPITGTVYSLEKQILLKSIAQQKGYKDSRWVTFNQAKLADIPIKKGSKGVPLTYYRLKTDEELKEDMNNPYKYEKKVFIVFNIQDCVKISAMETNLHKEIDEKVLDAFLENENVIEGPTSKGVMYNKKFFIDEETNQIHVPYKPTEEYQKKEFYEKTIDLIVEKHLQQTENTQEVKQISQLIVASVIKNKLGVPEKDEPIKEYKSIGIALEKNKELWKEALIESKKILRTMPIVNEIKHNKEMVIDKNLVQKYQLSMQEQMRVKAQMKKAKELHRKEMVL